MPQPPEHETPDPRPVRAGRHPAAVIAFLIVTAVILVGDLVSKSLAFEHVAAEPFVVSPEVTRPPAHPKVTLVPGVLGLKLMLNRGAAFGLGQGGVWLFSIIGVLAIAVIGGVFWTSEPRARVLHVALAMLLAGALGNLYDRVRFAQVRDFLWLFPDVPLPFGLKWPGGSEQIYPWIFNIADAAMCVGLGLLLFLMYRGRNTTPTTPRGDGRSTATS